jgi:hypothetical protein
MRAMVTTGDVRVGMTSLTGIMEND